MNRNEVIDELQMNNILVINDSPASHTTHQLSDQPHVVANTI